ncbi:MAG: hypothetical protein ABI539_11645 [Acidobacteriota bacterium]
MSTKQVLSYICFAVAAVVLLYSLFTQPWEYTLAAAVFTVVAAGFAFAVKGKKSPTSSINR